MPRALLAAALACLAIAAPAAASPVLVYDDGRHEVLNEINRDEVLDDLLRWLQRVSALPAVHDE